MTWNSLLYEINTVALIILKNYLKNGNRTTFNVECVRLTFMELEISEVSRGKTDNFLHFNFKILSFIKMRRTRSEIPII